MLETGYFQVAKVGSIQHANKHLDIEVWDDLWFWGFVTQKGSGPDRKLQWNPNKYWSLEHSNKNGNVIKAVERRAKNFLTILAKCRS